MESVAIKLLDRPDININQVNEYGNTSLIYACKFRMDNVVRCISSKIWILYIFYIIIIQININFWFLSKKIEKNIF